MNLDDLSEHYSDEHCIGFTEEYVDDLVDWRRNIIAYYTPDTYVPRASNSSGEEHQLSDFENFLDQPTKKESYAESS